MKNNNNLILIKNKKQRALFSLTYEHTVTFVPNKTKRVLYLSVLQSGFYNIYYHGTYNKGFHAEGNNIKMQRKMDGSFVSFFFFSPVIFYCSAI